MNEVFRFATVRPIQRAADSDIERRSIKAYGQAGHESSLHAALRGDTSVEDGEATERQDPRTVALAFVASPDFVSNLRSLDVPIADIDAWFRDREDRPAPRLVAEELGRLAALLTDADEETKSGQDKDKDEEENDRRLKREDNEEAGSLDKNAIRQVESFVGIEAYGGERVRVEESLLAATVAGVPRDDLVRALQIFGLIDKMAAFPDEFATADDVFVRLVQSTVVLPADVFTAISDFDGAVVEAAAEPLLSTPEGAEPNGPARDLEKVKAAISELRNALKTQLASTAVPVLSNPAPIPPNAPAPLALPVGAGPSPQPSAAVRMPEPFPALQAEPWLLPPDVLDSLSPTARGEIGAASSSELDEVLARPDNQGTGGTDQGGAGGAGSGGGGSSSGSSSGTGGQPPSTGSGTGSSPGAALDGPAKVAELECRAADLGGRIQMAAASAPDPTGSPALPAKWKPATVLARAPAIADLRIVRQTLRCYDIGEIAHIENVLKGESRGRTHRRTDTTEITTTFETETVRESEHELSTADRFELQTEASQTIQENTQFQAGVTVTAAWGPVSTTGNLGYASNQAKEESNRTASTFAHDVTERTLARLQERVREQRVRRTLTEIEEINTHEIDNSKAPTGHVVGIYRWIDKVYDAQAYDYGWRLMLDLVVPEPAAFFVQASNGRRPRGLERLEEPAPPEVVDEQTKKPRPLSPADVTYATYLSWVHAYKVADVKPPPRPFEVVSVAWDEPWRGTPTRAGGQAGDQPDEGQMGKLYYKARKDLKVPPGYEAVAFCATISTDAWKKSVFLGVGDVVMQGPDDRLAAPRLQLTGALTLKPGGDREVPIVLAVHNAYGYAIAVEVLCERTCAAYRQWQLQTYEAVMRAYYELKSQYDEAIAAAETQAGVAIQGRNPLENRMIERAELQRGAIAMLNGEQHDDLDALTINGGYPRIDFEQATQIQRQVAFFEHTLEWPQMTYLYYPYFWGSRDTWIEKLAVEDPDPLFAAFLRAGSARLTIPVRRGSELEVLHYLGTGSIWQGNQPPQIHDPMYLSIVAELRSREAREGEETAVGDSLEVRVPTTLVMLQADSSLSLHPAEA
jgi:hypothetical protein